MFTWCLQGEIWTGFLTPRDSGKVRRMTDRENRGISLIAKFSIAPPYPSVSSCGVAWAALDVASRVAAASPSHYCEPEIDQFSRCEG